MEMNSETSVVLQVKASPASSGTMIGSGDSGHNTPGKTMDPNIFQFNENSHRTPSATILFASLRNPSHDSTNKQLQIDTDDLAETLAGNILLKKELCDKVGEIYNLRNKLEESFNRSMNMSDSESAIKFSLPGSFSNRNNSLEFLSLVKLDQHEELKCPYLTDINEDSHSNGTLTSICEWVEQNRDDVVQTVANGTIVAKDIAVGGLAGITTAFVLQKFGKIAVTALGGGFLLLQAANYRGYIIVNWNQIYSQLEQGAFQVVPEDMQNGNYGENDDWITRQFKGFRDWSKKNSKIAIGFIGGFIYKTYF